MLGVTYNLFLLEQTLEWPHVSQATRDLEFGMEHAVAELPVLELITAIARALVDKPEEISVSATSVEFGTLLRLKADPSDVGKIIGKQGRTARSLRTLLGAISVKLKHRYSLEIIEHLESHPAKQERSYDA